MALDVSIRTGETQESLLKRFMRAVQVEGILREAKTRSRFVSNGTQARLKQQRSARRKRLGRERRMQGR